MNEYGEYVAPLLQGIAERYLLHGRESVVATWTDKCCYDRSTVQRTLGGLALQDFIHWDARWHDAGNSKDVAFKQFRSELKQACFIPCPEYAHVPGSPRKSWQRRIPDPETLRNRLEAVKTRFKDFDFVQSDIFKRRWDEQLSHVDLGCISDPPIDLKIHGESADGHHHYRVGRSTSQGESGHAVWNAAFESQSSYAVTHGNIILKACTYRTNTAQGIKFRKKTNFGSWHAPILESCRNLFQLVFETKVKNVFEASCLVPLGTRKLSDEQFFCDYVSPQDATALLTGTNISNIVHGLTSAIAAHFGLEDMKCVSLCGELDWPTKDPPIDDVKQTNMCRTMQLHSAGIPSDLWDAVRVGSSTFPNSNTDELALQRYCDLRFELLGSASAEQALQNILVPGGRPMSIAHAAHAAAHLTNSSIILLRADAGPRLFLPNDHTHVPETILLWMQQINADITFQA